MKAFGIGKSMGLFVYGDGSVDSCIMVLSTDLQLAVLVAMLGLSRLYELSLDSERS